MAQRTLKRRECHVCGKEVRCLKDGRLAKHYRGTARTRTRELCLGGGQMYRPPLDEVRPQGRRLSEWARQPWDTIDDPPSKS